MLAAVIPARNEAPRIQDVLREVLRLPVDLVIPVLNGCTDLTPALVGRIRDRRIRPVTYYEPLGYDVPRAAGARAALEAGARAVLFVDGDLSGRLSSPLAILLKAAARGMDLVLCDCYAETQVPYRDSAAREVYRHRVELNRALGRPDLGAAIPSHGPAAVSRKLLERVPMATLGVPPLMQAYACREGLSVGAPVPLPHKELGSAKRDRTHRLKIAETIIGDCIQALCLARGDWPNRHGYLGYHSERRFDLLGLRAPEHEPAPAAAERPAPVSQEPAPATGGPAPGASEFSGGED